jgi:ferritin-like metal-binding protein YciE
MKLESLDQLLEDELKDLYSAESQLVKALPKMAKAASNAMLREGILAHLEETKGQVERLNTVGNKLGIKLTGKKCKAMEGLLEEGKEILEMEGNDALIDAALIGAAQRVEHYEISGYGTARTIAEHLGYNEVAKLLDQTLQEESATDEKLTKISVEQVLPSSDGEEAGEEATNGAAKRATKKGAKKSAKRPAKRR